MVKSVKKALAALAALVLCLAFAAPVACFADEVAPSLGMLTNRYQDLETESQEVDETENVVVATRIGVLTAANRALDGSTVSFSGEVVGDIMKGGSDHKWLNLLGSDGSCIGVWVDDDMANRAVNTGDYFTTGTTLQVRGIYSIDCSDHQGELDVHAIDIRVLDAGGAVEHFVNEVDLNLGLQLCGIGFLLLVCFFMLRWWFDRRDFDAEEERNR